MVCGGSVKAPAIFQTTKNNIMTDRQFAVKLWEFKDLYQPDMLREFFEYWTEKNINGKKMRFEKEKTFGLSRRLSTWAKNEKKWNPKKQDAAEILLEKYGFNKT